MGTAALGVLLSQA